MFDPQPNDLLADEVGAGFACGVSAEPDPTLYVCARSEQATATISRDACAAFRHASAKLKGLPPNTVDCKALRFEKGLLRWLDGRGLWVLTGQK